MANLRNRRSKQRRRPTLVLGLMVAGLLGCGGCAQTIPSAVVQSDRASAPVDTPPRATIRLVQHTELPPPSELAPPPNVTADHGDKVLPINLDTVLRLAQDQNGQIQLAREQVNEAFANKALADKAWLPDIDVGVSYYRHEGGIQDVDGQFFHSSFGSLFGGLELHGKLDLREAVFLKIDAERKIWQQKGELSRLSNENLLDAANSYIDLLTARSGEIISLDAEQKIRKVLEKAKSLAEVEKGFAPQVPMIQAQLSAQQQITREAKAGARSAAAKLIQLLGLDPHSQLAVMDPRLVPFPLIPPNTATDDLVDAALRNGPGVQELESLLSLIDRADAQSRGPGRFMPIFEAKVAEGGFGAGPNDNMNWDNRLDILLQARWNVTSLCTARERQWAAKSKIAQAHLGYQNLRSRLTLGVQEAVETSASGAERMTLAENEIDMSRDAYKKSEERLTNIMGTAPSEVLLAARALAGAQLGYLNALRDFDKAQIRLLILTGKVANCTDH
jgi:outer membrane protein TolC